MAIKKILKILNKFDSHSSLAVKWNGKKRYAFLVYLKEPVSHKIMQRLTNAGLEDCLVIVDDQFGFRSDTSGYEETVRLRVPFSIAAFIRLWRNEFALLDDLMQKLLSDVEFECFLPIYDRSAEMEYFLPRYRHRFSKTLTIQHGSIGTPDKYFPFLSDFFIARSCRDIDIARRYLPPQRKCLVLGGNILAPYISPQTLERKIENRLASKKGASLLFATGFDFRSTLRFLFAAIRSANSTDEIHFKPHPSDRLRRFHALVIRLAQIMGKNVHLIDRLDPDRYDFLVTESSSLMFELLREGTLPIIFNPRGKPLPEYVEPWLRRTRRFPLDIEEIRKYYAGRMEEIKNFYYRNNYQSDRFGSPETLYRKILEEACGEGTVRCTECYELLPEKTRNTLSDERG